MTELNSKNQFVEAGQGSRPGLLSEFIIFLKYNKKWWLIPILAMVVFLGGLMLLGGGAAAPFVYTLF